MKRPMMYAALMLLLGLPILAHGQANRLAQTPQQPQSTPPAPSAPGIRTYVPKLGDLMVLTQLRHYKLWYAGKVKNWGLAKYELDQMKNSFYATLKFYPGVPEADMTTMEKPASAIASAIDAQDNKKFINAYLQLSVACTSCHRSHGYPFIVIKTPGANLASPFADQIFEK